jgi:hypothetical protein
MDNIDLLQRCCRLIEQKLGWGNSDNWQNQDFEALSAQIYDHTQVTLSVSTLKRVWGKVKYDNFPALTTLNTLAIFAGFESWRHFRQLQTSGSEAPPAPSENGHTIAEPRRRHMAWYLIPGILAVIVIAGWVYNRSAGEARPADPADAARFSFSSQPLSKGIPNSVIFNYDAAAAKSDSVFIQQSWDPKRRFQVPANGHTYTSMYYYPGYFRAKLIVGNRIVKEHELYIPSNGWLAAVDQEPVPVYFSKEEVIKDGALRIPASLLESRNIPLQPKVPEVRYYNIRDMNGLRNDNFIFETELKSEYNQGTAICQHVFVTIHCEKTAIMIPLGIPGCVAEMGLMVVDKGVSAQEADLSAFGCNMNEWVKLRCEARNKQVQIWVNGRKAYSTTFKEEANKIVGVSYRFMGTGAVNAVRFARPNGEAVLEDTF